MGRAWIVISVLLCACGGGGGGGKATASEPAPIENKQVEQAPPPPPPPPEAEAQMMAMKRFTRELCACAAGDAECARRVTDDMTAWSQKMLGNERSPIKMTEAQQQEMAEIGTRMGECMQRAMARP